VGDKGWREKMEKWAFIIKQYITYTVEEINRWRY